MDGAVLRAEAPYPARYETDLPARAVAAAPGVALALRDIELSFGGVRALKGVSLDVLDGEIRAVIGPNGAGKSSLVNVISGLYRADKGSVSIGGESFRRVPANRLAELGVARTFQNLTLFSRLSVKANIASGLVHTRRAGILGQVLGLPGARREECEIGRQVAEVAALLKLEPHLDRPAGKLPYGLQKRVELARALVARPVLLLLDEPMAGMTPAEKAEMADSLRLARAERRFSIILIEHDIGVVMGLSDRIAVLDYGRKIADGTPDQVRRNPEVVRAYIGTEAEAA
jgi:branched-chain amino acid transport system ATP-binding protein